ncbi:MAG: leucine-rich repeat domain-containing protein, partial [Lachnospiraceae bacterium]
MKKSNRLLSIFLCLAILITSLVGFTSISYAATRSFTSGDLSCTLDTDTGVFTVKGSGRGAGYANSATKRAPWYTAYRSQIKSVIIENGVIEIGAYWFYNCANLTSVTFADSVDTIGDCCFRSCTSLQNITLPKNCSWYYKELFLDCTALKWAVMPENNNTTNYNSSIPEGTFRGCTSLEEVYIGPGYTAIDSNAFNNCRSLHGVIWNSGTITNVGTDALNSVPNSCVFFSPDNSLRSWASSYNKAALSLNGSCSNNGSLSYSLDTNDRVLLLNFSGSGTMTSTPWTNFRYLIKDISFSGTDNSFTIAANAFNGAQSLSTVAFNKNCPGILTIGDGAFQNCTGSTYWLDIPKNCTDIGNNAFNNTNFNWVKF